MWAPLVGIVVRTWNSPDSPVQSPVHFILPQFSHFFVSNSKLWAWESGFEATAAILCWIEILECRNVRMKAKAAVCCIADPDGSLEDESFSCTHSLFLRKQYTRHTPKPVSRGTHPPAISGPERQAWDATPRCFAQGTRAEWYLFDLWMRQCSGSSASTCFPRRSTRGNTP